MIRGSMTPLFLRAAKELKLMTERVTGRFIAWWEDDPTKTREVIGACKVCDAQYAIDELEPMLVSPTGLIHHADTDRTLCGKDATGPEWWWRT